MSVWHCGARNCPTHSQSGHRCQVGVWFCGRRQPPCPGHSSRDHRCTSGTVWHCDARNCPTHSRPEHRCQVGVWFCGQRQPPCPGHRSKDHRCIETQSITNYWRVLLPNESANRNYRITSHGAELQCNKELLLRAFNARSIRDDRRVLMMAMAMIETNHLSPNERDASKDNRTDGSANASIFNLSEDMLRQLGYWGDIHLLDPLQRLSDVVGLINNGINTWGVTRLLNFVRGGRTAFNDGVSYDAAGYRNAVATTIRVIDMDPSLMRDDRRVEINVPHQ